MRSGFLWADSGRCLMPRGKCRNSSPGTHRRPIKDDLRMKIARADCRVLVTGGAGFIGSHLVDALAAAGCRVTVLDNFRNGKRENLAQAEKTGRVRILAEDITD